MDDWNTMEGFRNQCSKQQELLKNIATSHISYLSPSTQLSLVNGITKTFIYNPSQPPILLVYLPDMLSKHENCPLGLQWAVGVCLTVSAFAKNDYPSRKNNSGDDSNPRMKQSKATYQDLVDKNPSDVDVEPLLTFGVLELLRKPRTEYEPGFLFEHPSHFAFLASAWLDPSPEESGSTLNFGALRLSYIDALLRPNWCGPMGTLIIPMLMKCFAESQSLELKIRCLEALRDALPDIHFGQYEKNVLIFKSQLAQSDFLDRLLEFMQSDHRHGLPYILIIIWIAATLLDSADDTCLLKKFCDNSTAPSVDTGTPQGPHRLGLVDPWRRDIEEMCTSDPQNILKSQILDRMIAFYEDDHNKALHPIDSPDDPRTWLTIIQDLKENCEKRIASQAETNKSNNQNVKPESGPDVHNKPVEGNEEPSNNM